MPSIGAACGMGHRHTPEEQGTEGGVCGAGHGFLAVGEERAGERVVVSSAGVRVALLALRFYKAYLSLLFAGCCRFEPTCSQFSYEAIERFGVARGSWLTLKRLARCQPFSGRFGYDPVPEIEEKDDGFSTEGTKVRAQRSRRQLGAAEVVTHQEVHS
jgi:putative membrane protein insertion efficiency factor